MHDASPPGRLKHSMAVVSAIMYVLHLAQSHARDVIRGANARKVRGEK
jgi:hypothetical protein